MHLRTFCGIFISAQIKRLENIADTGIILLCTIEYVGTAFFSSSSDIITSFSR